MDKWLRTILTRISNLFASPQPSADRRRLMGMYLSGANQPATAGLRGAPTRERHDGKYAQTRKRE